MLIIHAVVLIFMLAVMTAAWATVRKTGNAGWTDVFWTFGTGVSGVLAALSPWGWSGGAPTERQLLVAVLVVIWSIRLGSYIAIRVARTEEDTRYRLLKAEWGQDFDRRLFGLAVVQAPATTLLSASIAAAALRPGNGLTAEDLIGAAILLVAILGEGRADGQMKAFKADPANRGKIMDRGLWSLSRHPNYVFEWLGWVAYPIIAIDLTGGWPWGWASLIAPVVMYLILTRLTGVPPLEAAMLQSKGLAYADYQKRVGAFFPVSSNLEDPMSLIANSVNRLQDAPFPDFLTRPAIALLVANARRDLESQPSGVDAEFAREMAARPVAEHADAANQQHYELPARFFELCLGKHRKYSSCFYETPDATLDEAEVSALRITCEHADLRDGQSILELGCGWGSLSLWMAERYPGSTITAVSNSRSQKAFIDGEARRRGLNNLTVMTADMNVFSTDRIFDRIVSVEMFEHMANWRMLLSRAAGWLKPGGRMFIHVFSHRDRPYRFEVSDEADFIAQHFFTGGVMPSHGLMAQYGDLLTIEDQWRWSGTHYQRTANDWLRNMDAHAEEIRGLMSEVYGEQAALWTRRWRRFYMATAGLFGDSDGQVWGVSHYRLKKA